jgi:hypothetical protein
VSRCDPHSCPQLSPVPRTRPVGSTTFWHDILQLFHISKQVWSHSSDVADGPGRVRQPATAMSPARTKRTVDRVTESHAPWRNQVPQKGIPGQRGAKV